MTGTEMTTMSTTITTTAAPGTAASAKAGATGTATALGTAAVKRRTIWTFAVTATALFMASLDNLVVSTALPAIRMHLHAGLSGLQWTVNAYTLTFAVLLLTGATLGER